MIQPAASPVADKILIVQRSAKDLPEHLGANRLLVWFFAKGRFPQGRQRFILRRDMFRQCELVLAFRINRFHPESRPRFGREIEQRAGKQRVRGTVRRQHQADRLERFADDEGDAMLGRLQKQLAVNGCRKTGDNNGRHILQRKFLFTFRRFASQLAVSATKRALRRVYADDVVGHASVSELLHEARSGDGVTPHNGTFTTSSLHFIIVATEALSKTPGTRRL